LFSAKAIGEPGHYFHGDAGLKKGFNGSVFNGRGAELRFFSGSRGLIP
jgi:hypothetical protein